PTEVETPPIDDPRRADPRLTADVVIYVLALAASEADLDAIGRVEDPLVVLNKADAVAGNWADVLAAAQAQADVLGGQVVALVGVLAARTLAVLPTEAEVRSLRQLATADDPTLTLSPDLFLAAHVATDVRARRTMLERWDRFGIDCALTALRADRELTAEQL